MMRDDRSSDPRDVATACHGWSVLTPRQRRWVWYRLTHPLWWTWGAGILKTFWRGDDYMLIPRFDLRQAWSLNALGFHICREIRAGRW